MHVNWNNHDADRAGVTAQGEKKKKVEILHFIKELG